MKKLLPVLFLLICFLTTSNASVINGEITYKQISPLEIEVEVIIYYSSGAGNLSDFYARDSIYIDWGDDASSAIPRTNGNDTDNNGIPDGEAVSNLFTKNIYRGVHEYSVLGAYTLAHQQANRNDGILNLNFPNSINLPFHIEAQVQLVEAFTNNRSPVLLEAPVDFAYVNQPFMHYINAFDQDDDSLSYALIQPLVDHDQPAPNYVYPEMINADPVNNIFTLDPVLGAVVWSSPQQSGIYVVTIEITSYRNGQVFDKVMRDMQILVLPEVENSLPQLTVDPMIQDYQIVQVGDTVNFDVYTADPDGLQMIELNSSSGLYDFFEQPAEFQSVNGIDEAIGNFDWVVKPEHVRQNAYQVVFKSKDDVQGTGYANFKMVRFKVVDDLINSVQEEALRQQISVYPNPVSEFINIDIKDQRYPLNFQLRSLDGRLMVAGLFNDVSNRLKISDLPSGKYIIMLSDKQGNTITDFIIKN
jgi:hypothetical protein